jgi:hypothetical protein
MCRISSRNSDRTSIAWQTDGSIAENSVGT